MSIFFGLLVAVQVLSAVAMVGLILLQHGKGADMGASFGSGSAGSVFGASGSANFLSRTTAVLAVVFFGTTLALAYFGHASSGAGGGDSVLERAVTGAAAPAVPVAPAAAPAIPAAPASSIPSGNGNAPAPGATAAQNHPAPVTPIPTK
ncbi:MAG: preprotein translocase subunit SecG [Burkholderiaceae bacterium]|jgi:preprotein translocase subunit SecG|nr:preprotein translocase subunit SecG [Burkholderiaceae bacterium]